MAELRAAGNVQNKFVLLVRSRPCANRGWAGGSTRPDCLFRRDVPHGARGGWGRRRLVLFRGDPAGPATRGPGLTLTQGKRPPTLTSPLISTGKPGPRERAGARAQQKPGPASPAGSSRGVASVSTACPGEGGNRRPPRAEPKHHMPRSLSAARRLTVHCAPREQGRGPWAQQEPRPRLRPDPRLPLPAWLGPRFRRGRIPGLPL